MDYTTAEITTIAMFVLVAHSVPVEAAIAQKNRVVCREIFSVPYFIGHRSRVINGLDRGDDLMSASAGAIFHEILFGSISTMINMLKILIPLMIIVEILMVYNVMEKVADKLRFFAGALGMKKQSIFPLLVGVVMGITYGAGTLIQINRQTPIPKKDFALIGIFYVFMSWDHRDRIYFRCCRCRYYCCYHWQTGHRFYCNCNCSKIAGDQKNGGGIVFAISI